MKKIIKILAIILTFCVLLSGCGGNKTPSQGTQEKESAPEMKTATLYTNKKTGSQSAEFEAHPFEYSGDLTSEKLADGLSQLTGLDFFLRETPSSKNEEINIDWGLSSTLIANLDHREQKKEFFFFDEDSMRWFMMDSLWRTLTKNFGVENIYYTMDGGNDLVFDGLYPIKEFPNDLPYMGSAFYFAHADVKGDVASGEDKASAPVENTIKVQGESAPKMKTATLYTNKKTGSQSAEFEAHPFEYSGDLTSEKLADGLSQLTGLDFFLRQIPSSKSEDINIDWGLSSTLIANLDDREQKKEFWFYDSDSMRWFMMDSLWRTLTKNFGVENIYYTMDVGNDLVFDELYPIKKFTNDLPYMGSAFYSAHADVKGDVAISEDEAFALVENTKKVRGETAPVIVRTGDETIEGQHAFTFSAGSYAADGKKYTAMYHYAVSDGGKVYYMDILQGADWVLFDK